MEIKRQSVAFNILRNFKETENIMTVENVVNTINDNFNKGLIDELTAEQAFEQIEILEKAMGHKYYKREGTPGNYRYYYTEGEYNKAKGKKTEEGKKSVLDRAADGESHKKESSSFNWDSGDAKILAKFGITKDNLVVKDNLDLFESNITSLPEGLKVGGNLDLHRSFITSLPKGLEVEGHLSLSETSITSLPEELKVGGDLNLYKSSINSLPEGLKVGGHLYLSNSSITSLPKGLEVGGDLNLWRTSITSLPEGLKVGGSLNLKGTPITSLPEGLEVGGHLSLYKSSINSLPEGLKVGGNLDLSETSITSLPKGLEVGGNLYLLETSITAKDFKDSMEISGIIRLDPKNKIKTKFRFD